MFTARQFGKIAPMLAEINGNTRDWMESLTEGKSTMEGFDVQMKSFDNQMKQFSNNITHAKQSMYEMVKTVGSDVLPILNGLYKAIGDNNSVLSRTTGEITGVALAVGVLGVAFQALNIGNVIKSIGVLAFNPILLAIVGITAGLSAIYFTYKNIKAEQNKYTDSLIDGRKEIEKSKKEYEDLTKRVEALKKITDDNGTLKFADELSKRWKDHINYYDKIVNANKDLVNLHQAIKDLDAFGVDIKEVENLKNVFEEVGSTLKDNFYDSNNSFIDMIDKNKIFVSDMDRIIGQQEQLNKLREKQNELLEKVPKNLRDSLLAMKDLEVNIFDMGFRNSKGESPTTGKPSYLNEAIEYNKVMKEYKKLDEEIQSVESDIQKSKDVQKKSEEERLNLLIDSQTKISNINDMLAGSIENLSQQVIAELMTSSYSSLNEYKDAVGDVLPALDDMIEIFRGINNEVTDFEIVSSSAFKRFAPDIYSVTEALKTSEEASKRLNEQIFNETAARAFGGTVAKFSDEELKNMELKAEGFEKTNVFLKKLLDWYYKAIARSKEFKDIEKERNADLVFFYDLQNRLSLDQQKNRTNGLKSLEIEKLLEEDLKKEADEKFEFEKKQLTISKELTYEALKRRKLYLDENKTADTDPEYKEVVAGLKAYEAHMKAINEYEKSVYNIEQKKLDIRQSLYVNANEMKKINETNAVKSLMLDLDSLKNQQARINLGDNELAKNNIKLEIARKEKEIYKTQNDEALKSLEIAYEKMKIDKNSSIFSLKQDIDLLEIKKEIAEQDGESMTAKELENQIAIKNKQLLKEQNDLTYDSLENDIMKRDLTLDALETEFELKNIGKSGAKLELDRLKFRKNKLEIERDSIELAIKELEANKSTMTNEEYITKERELQNKLAQNSANITKSELDDEIKKLAIRMEQNAQLVEMINLTSSLMSKTNNNDFGILGGVGQLLTQNSSGQNMFQQLFKAENFMGAINPALGIAGIGLDVFNAIQQAQQGKSVAELQAEQDIKNQEVQTEYLGDIAKFSEMTADATKTLMEQTVKIGLAGALESGISKLSTSEKAQTYRMAVSDGKIVNELYTAEYKYVGQLETRKDLLSAIDTIESDILNKNAQLKEIGDAVGLNEINKKIQLEAEVEAATKLYDTYKSILDNYEQYKDKIQSQFFGFGVVMKDSAGEITDDLSKAVSVGLDWTDVKSEFLNNFVDGAKEGIVSIGEYINTYISDGFINSIIKNDVELQSRLNGLAVATETFSNNLLSGKYKYMSSSDILKEIVVSTESLKSRQEELNKITALYPQWWIEADGKISDISNVLIPDLYDKMTDVFKADSYKDSIDSLGSYLYDTLAEKSIKDIIDNQFSSQLLNLNTKLSGVLSQDFNLGAAQGIMNEFTKFSLQAESQANKIRLLRDMLDPNKTPDYQQTNNQIEYSSGSTSQNVWNIYNNIGIEGVFFSDKSTAQKIANDMVDPLIIACKSKGISLGGK